MFGFPVQRYKKSDKLASVLTETGVSSNLIDAKRGFFVDRPDTWSDCSSDNSPNVLVKVNESDDQYWDVAEQLHKNMPDAHISTVWWVQNEALWFYYSFQKQRLALNGIAANETAVWHGTSSTEPSVIHNDTQDGFMMQCARNGVWGRGIYFAEKSGYSDQYAFRPSRQGGVTVDRPLGGDDEREMFLSKLLVGKAVEMDGYNTLTAPPLDDHSKMRYNTVTGTQCGSPIYIVYENGRAYPEYLVRYYRSQHRDTQRTPYRNKEEAKRSRASSGDSSGSGTSGGVVWEFMDTTEWKSYSVSHQNTLETAYKNYVNDGSGSKKIVDIRTSEWAYRVDLATMVQTNVGHASRTQRGLFNAEPSLLPLIPFSRPRMMPLYGSSWTETDGDRIQCRSSLPWKLRTKVQ